MFNVQGSELIFLLLIALIVLGPDKLPDAVRRFGKAYGEFKKLANGFQGELRNALDEPLREMRGTADAVRKAASFDTSSTSAPAPAAPAESPDTAADPASPAPPRTPVRRDQGLNFGNANARRQARIARATDAGVADAGVTDAAVTDDGPSDAAPAVEDADE